MKRNFITLCLLTLGFFVCCNPASEDAGKTDQNKLGSASESTQDSALNPTATAKQDEPAVEKSRVVFRHKPGQGLDDQYEARDADSELIFSSLELMRLSGYTYEGSMGSGYELSIDSADLKLWAAMIDALFENGRLRYFTKYGLNEIGQGLEPIPEEYLQSLPRQQLRSAREARQAHEQEELITTPLYFEPDHESILESILQDALQVDDHRVAENYAQGSTQVLLINSDCLYAWPENFQPEVAGYEFYRSVEEILTDSALAIELSAYGPIRDEDLKTLPYSGAQKTDWKLEITFTNAKGNGPIGGQFTYYSFTPETGEFQLRMTFDP